MNFDNRTDPYWYSNSLYCFHNKRPMKGGLILEKDKLLDKIKSDNIEDIEKVKRAYERGLEDIETGLNYDDEGERERDEEQVKQMIDSLNDRIEILKNEEEMNKYNIEYEDDIYPTEAEKEKTDEYIKKIKDELEDIDKKINEDNYTKKDYIDYVNRLYNLYNLTENQIDKLKYIEALEKFEKEYNEEYIFNKDDNEGYKKEKFRTLTGIINKKIKEIRENKQEQKNNGVNIEEAEFQSGIIFEEVVLNYEYINNMVKEMTGDNSDLINNNTNPNLNRMVNFNGGQKKLSEFYIYDLSQEKNEIELKYYDTDKFRIYGGNNNKGVPLQVSKFGNYNFHPLFKEDESGNLKLYNINENTTNVYINKNFMKDVYILYKLADGIYSYHLNADENHKRKSEGIDTDGKEIYSIEPSYKIYDVIEGVKITPTIYIPISKLKKIL